MKHGKITFISRLVWIVKSPRSQNVTTSSSKNSRTGNNKYISQSIWLIIVRKIPSVRCATYAGSTRTQVEDRKEQTRDPPSYNAHRRTKSQRSPPPKTSGPHRTTTRRRPRSPRHGPRTHRTTRRRPLQTQGRAPRHARRKRTYAIST